jgi:acyl-CoA thioester hydrolase
VPHTYECPMRWADMDLLGHVNNVTYLDYLAEAREHLFAGHGAARATVSLHQVEFVSPLVFRRRPVSVDSWVVAVTEDGLTLGHEVYDPPVDGAGTRTVYLRAETTLDHRLTEAERALVDQHRGAPHEWRPLVVESRPHGDAYALTVRRSDIDDRGVVSDVTFFEYVQEARIQYLMNLHTRGEKWSQHVIARTDVDYREPIRHRLEPYAVHSWIGHLGSRSFTIRSEVRDGDLVVAGASVVLVCFDLETQRTAEMAAAQRTRLEQELR